MPDTAAWTGDRDRIGPGISGVISRRKIISAIGSHGLAFVFRPKSGKWKLSPNVPAGTPDADLALDLEHDMDPADFDEGWTVTDMISDQLGMAMERLRQAVEGDY